MTATETLQLLVSVPWDDERRTRVLAVPLPTTDDGSSGLTAGAVLAPLLKEAEAEAKRALPPLVATYHGKR